MVLRKQASRLLEEGLRAVGSASLQWSLGLVLLVVAAWGWGGQGIETRRLAGVSDAVGESGPDLIQPGAHLDIRGVIRPGRRTVVLFTAIACPLGLVDADFYRAMWTAAHREPEGFDVVVVTDDAPEVVTAWLEDHDVRVDGVVGPPEIVDLNAIGLHLTPTLVVVDGHGIVTDVVVGVIEAETEERLLAMLVAGRGGLVNNLPDPPLVRAQEGGGHPWGDGARLVDVRSRVAYRRAHDSRATNIPADELSTRGRVELATVEHVVVDCRVGVLRECRGAARELAMELAGGVSVLVR